MQSFAQEVFGKLVTCKSEVGDWLGGFCQPFKAGKRTSQIVRNRDCLVFLCRFFFFFSLDVRLEEAFVKLKP